MFSQKAGKSPLAEKRLMYSSLKRGIFGRRCYSESTFIKKKKDERPSSSQEPMITSVIELVELSVIPCVQAH